MSKRRAPTTPLHQPFPRTFRNRQASKQDVKPDPKCEFLSQRSLSHAGCTGAQLVERVSARIGSSHTSRPRRGSPPTNNQP